MSAEFTNTKLRGHQNVAQYFLASHHEVQGPCQSFKFFSSE